MTNSNIYPTMLKLQVPYWYKPLSYIEILDSPNSDLVDVQRTQIEFDLLSQKLYFPLFKFIKENQVGLNLIVSGEFVLYASKNPKLFKVFTDLLDQDYISLIADTYYSNSLCAIYSQEVWQKTLEKTLDYIKTTIAKPISAIFLPQVFRGLELERLTSLGIFKFVSQRPGKKYSNHKIKLSDFRRMQGHQISWIKEFEDWEGEFHFIPDTDFFVVNGNIWQPNLAQAGKTFNFAVAFASSQYLIRKDLSKIRTQQHIRISEKSSLSLYNDLSKSCIRLFDYGQRLITSQIHTNLFEDCFLADFLRLQNPQFLYNTEKSLYHQDPVYSNFSSPYEAWAFVQARIKQIEILVGQQP